MRKVFLKFIPVFFLLGLQTLLVSGQPKNDGSSLGFSEIQQKCRQLLLSDTAYATERSYQFTDDIKYSTDAHGYFKALAADGSWKDIDYHSDQRNAWKPGWHLYRLLLIYRAYDKNMDPQYLAAIHKALAFWIKNDFQGSNWWPNQINVPFSYSSLMLMLGKSATPDELAYLETKLIKRIPLYRGTGQNSIWQYDNEARVALIHGDPAAFARAMANMQQIIQISVKEGIQPDYSFQQHGVMLQFGNYGLHFVNSLAFWIKVTCHTPFAFAADKQQIFFDYCTNGIRWSIYQKAMDITAIGRQIRENCALKRGINLYDDFNLLRSLDPASATCKYAINGFKGNQQACGLTGNKNFWRSDYMIHRSGDQYMMSVKTHGNGVKKVEAINGENLKGSFLNDGVTLIQRTGREYSNIEALWNWNMLPGTTCDTTLNPADKKIFNSSNDPSTFVGQLSNGKEGASAMYYNRLGVEAYKSYFFVNDLMVALGAGIKSPNDQHVVTTLDQRYYRKNKGLISIKNNKGEQWIWQDSTAYVSLDKSQEIKKQTCNRTGNWGDIDNASGNSPVAAPLITLFVSQHQKAQYAYLIKPNISLPEAKVEAQKAAIKVITNTENAQGIAFHNTYMIVFYKPGNVVISGKMSISADRPCLMIYKNDAQPILSVADPSKQSGDINIGINKRVVPVKLPTGDLTGSTITLKLK